MTKALISAVLLLTILGVVIATAKVLVVAIVLVLLIVGLGGILAFVVNGLRQYLRWFF